MSKRISIIAGGAGFIGANLAAKLLERGHTLVIADNYSRGTPANLGPLADHPDVTLIQADLSERAATAAVFERAAVLGAVDEVWHLAANSDIQAGVRNPDVDFKDTFCTTFELLRAMQAHGVRQLHFASSSAIYGDLGEAVLHEAIGPLLPISNYGAMKLASEAQASAAAESFLDRVNLFRFPNVVGVPATHGVLLDFVRKLIATPRELQVLGDGTQQKSYLHVSDLVGAMLTIRDRASAGKVEVVNIGPTDVGVTVKWISEQVVARVSPGAAIVYGQGNKGWVGDVPKFNYSTDRLQSFGWSPRLGSAQAIQRSIDEIARQCGV
jgi:UDP-glucose 4-epimerase